MTALNIQTPVKLPSGIIVAVEIDADTFMTDYADSFHEWVGGIVLAMSPVSVQHDDFTRFLRYLLDTYLDRNPIGRTLAAPVVMRLEQSFREPDVQLILHDNTGTIGKTGMLGPADLCIEVVSDESHSRDYGDKLAEYEAGGVREYWIIDPLRQWASFYRLQDTGRYAKIDLSAEGVYHTPLMPHFGLPIALLWQDSLPGVSAIAEMVKAMFA